MSNHNPPPGSTTSPSPPTLADPQGVVGTRALVHAAVLRALILWRYSIRSELGTSAAPAPDAAIANSLIASGGTRMGRVVRC